MKKILKLSFIALLMFPFLVFAKEVDFDFTDENQNRSGENFQWNANEKTLELSGINIESQIILPENSTILIKENTSNQIKTTSSSIIKSSDTLNIKGKGTLTLETNSESTGYDVFEGLTNIFIESIKLNSSGLTGIKASNLLSIKNSQLDIYGYNYGIDVITSTENTDAYIEIINCSGKIKGELTQGIELYNKSTGNARLLIENSTDLSIIGNETNKKYHSAFHRSGVRVMSPGINDVESQVKIKNSKNLYFTGTNTGIAVNCTSDTPSSETGACQASLIIEDSSVISETPTSVWAAFFVNNPGENKNSLSKITIKNSNVSSLTPNDVGMMTSSDGGSSIIEVQNSVVEVSGKYAGLRAKSNKTEDGEIIVVDNSLIVVVDEIANNHNALDEMDKGVSSSGTDGISNDSKVITPIDCIITKNEDGTWDIPDNGKILINGEENSYLYGALVKNTREVLPYITSLNEKEFVDLNDAIDKAKEGDTVELLISDGSEKAVLPKGITLTSPKQITVTTNSYGHKIKEKKNEDKYVYTVIEADKYKIIYHLDYNSETTETIEVYENTECELRKDLFVPPKGKELEAWIIDNKEYKPGDTINITNKDIHVYAKWKDITTNPETADSFLRFKIIGTINVFIIVAATYYVIRRIKKDSNQEL